MTELLASAARGRLESLIKKGLRDLTRAFDTTTRGQTGFAARALNLPE
jgi:hypothetical protein